MKAVRLFIASNGVPYLQMRSVGSHIKSGIEKEELKHMTGSGCVRSCMGGIKI
jgi:hypothetical protein